MENAANIIGEKEKEIEEMAARFSEENSLGEEVNAAYIRLVGTDWAKPEDAEKAYQGEHASDEAFARQLLEDLGEIPDDLPSYVHIDWGATARDVMMDYGEQDGFYFRIL